MQEFDELGEDDVRKRLAAKYLVRRKGTLGARLARHAGIGSSSRSYRRCARRERFGLAQLNGGADRQLDSCGRPGRGSDCARDLNFQITKIGTAALARAGGVSRARSL
jgi:hypothetical protein